MGEDVTWRLTEPHKGWARWTWRVPAAYLRPQIPSELAQVPGVKVAEVSPLEGYVEAHESTWPTQVFSAWRSVPRSVTKAAVVSPDLKLFSHQVEAVQCAFASTTGILLADEMGLGKSRAAAVAVVSRVQPSDKILIVAPKYLRGTWRRELNALGFLRDEDDFLALETLDNGKHDAAMAKARWWFVHYDVLDAWTSRITFNLSGKRPSAVIFDEAHNARNVRTKRGAAMNRVSGIVPFRMVLTGTPHVSRPSDLHNLLTAVDGPRSWGSLFEFKRRYCGLEQTDFGYREGEPTNTEEFQARLAGRFLARTKAEVGLSLPPLTRAIVDVEKRPGFDDELKGLLRHYHVSAEDIVAAIRDGGAPGELVLKALHALRKHTSDAKRQSTLDLLGDVFEQGQSALVFCQEREMTEALEEEFAHRARDSQHSCYIHGGLPDTVREELLTWFQTGERIGAARVLFATYGALREGVTLTAASHVVLHDLDWTPSVIFQAEGRAHRIGLRHAVTSHWMTLVDSIDTLFAEALLRKAREQRALLASGAGVDALEAMSIAEVAGATSVEDDARRLMDAWSGASL